MNKPLLFLVVGLIYFQSIYANTYHVLYLGNSLTFKIKARFIQYILNTEVILFFQGNQWIYKSLSSSYLNVKNFIHEALLGEFFRVIIERGV